MKTSLFLAAIVSLVVGCGGDRGDCADCENLGSAESAACQRDDCEPIEDPIEPVVVSADLTNTTAQERVCDMAHSYILAGGGTAPGELYIFTLIPGAIKNHTIVAPVGSSVVFTARCWLPGYPERVEQASGTIQTGPLYTSWAIHATYFGNAAPSMNITHSEH